MKRKRSSVKTSKVVYKNRYELYLNLLAKYAKRNYYYKV